MLNNPWLINAIDIYCNSRVVKYSNKILKGWNMETGEKLTIDNLTDKITELQGDLEIHYKQLSGYYSILADFSHDNYLIGCKKTIAAIEIKYTNIKSIELTINVLDNLLE